MNANRSQKIAEIIQKRQPLVEKLERVDKNLTVLYGKLNELIAFGDRFLLPLNDSSAIQEFKELDLTELKDPILHLQEQLQKLKARFSRSTLNIGVVGRARQGKSRLLQSLSGLTSVEIPDGDREYCTGVRSAIYHNSNQDEDAYGEVYFHSEESFLKEIISPYYQKLHLGDVPATVNQFARDPLPQLPRDLSGNAEHKAMYEHLKKYRDNLDRYRHLLVQSSPLSISRDRIREYVAQDTPEGERIYFNFFAVKEVKITCHFSNADVGKIALVDMPGLGDTGIGDEERMVRTLGQDVDAVLFVRMPKSLGDPWADVDVKLYDTAKKALVDLPIDLWSFMVLNRTDVNSKNGDNYQNCLDLEKTICTQHIDVVNCTVTNCANQTEANQMLDLVLNYLADKIAELDKRYALVCQEHLDQLQKDLGDRLNKARNLFLQFESDSQLALSLSEALLEDLSIGLVQLRDDLHQRREEIDPYFQQQVKAALEACKNNKGISSEQDIVRRAIAPDLKGSYLATYRVIVAELRAHLSRHFLSLNEGLKQSINAIKSDVTEVLVSQGRLGELIEKRETEFLYDLAELLAADHQHHQLELGFRTLWEFDLSYSGLLLTEIRQCLDELLTPDTNNPPDQPLDAATVRTNLEHFYEQAIDQCEKVLEKWLSVPSRAGYYMVEEFVDRILYAEGLKKEWSTFLSRHDVRSQIWPEFKVIEERQQMLQTWNALVEEARIANQLDALQFLN